MILRTYHLPGGRAQDEVDAEKSTILAGFVVLGIGRGFCHGSILTGLHVELIRLWSAPLSTRSCTTGLGAVTSLDGRAAKGFVEIPQVERSVETVQSHSGPPETFSKAPWANGVLSTDNPAWVDVIA